MSLMLNLLFLAVIGMAFGQTNSIIPKRGTLRQRLWVYEDQLGPILSNNKPYFVAAAETPIIPQLFVSDQEALALCQPYAVANPSVFIPHPRSCAAYIQCIRWKKNPFRTNTVYRITVHMFATAEGTFFDKTKFAGVAQSIENNCPVDPCKTGKRTTDSRACNTYLTCVRDNDGNPVGYRQGTCGNLESFDVGIAACVKDNTCNPSNKYQETNLYCNATTPTKREKVPGIPPEAYYTRTFENGTIGANYTDRRYCSSSLVFDASAPEKCRCVAPNDVACRRTLIDCGSTGQTTWSAISINHVQDGLVKVIPSGVHKDWANFTGIDASYCRLSALSHNELSAKFVLSFRFVMQSEPADSVALVSNSLSQSVCPESTVKVFLLKEANNYYMMAELVNIVGQTISIKSHYVFPMNLVTVKLEGDGQDLTLIVNGQRTTQPNVLGGNRLKKTSCGLVIARTNGLLNFNGYMDSVKLVTFCTIVPTPAPPPST